VEEQIKKLAGKITDYGFNDEYGYYSDWLDGVEPIIKNGVMEILKEEREKIFREIKDIIIKDITDSETEIELDTRMDMLKKVCAYGAEIKNKFK